MGCLRLPYREEKERSNFLGVWKKTASPGNCIDYYPFGLTFNSYKRENSVQNKHLFNGGSELQTDLNLGWYSTLFRIYDPAIGRFLQIDPLTDFFSGITPYNFAENNPVLYGDPSGLSPTIWQRVKAFFGIGRLGGDKKARNQEYVKPVGRNKGEKKPYYFRPPESIPTRTPIRPAPQPEEPTQTVAQEDPEEEEDTYIPPAPIPKPKPKPKPVVKPNPVVAKQPDPTPLPFDIKPGGTTFDGYQFEPDKSDLYRTPANDKLIKDLIITLKSSSSVHLEIKGNVNADPSWWYRDHQRKLSSGRAQAIYDALRAAGIPASQLTTSPGEIRRKEGNMSATFKLTKQ
jgi:RHS repeat-associated protein